jgi:hypothetical protein
MRLSRTSVALLQHFSLSEALKHQLAASGGSLPARGLLSSLAEQFGRATGHKGALRSALDLLRHDAEERDASPSEAALAPSGGKIMPETATVAEAMVRECDFRTTEIGANGLAALGRSSPTSRHLGRFARFPTPAIRSLRS